MSRKLQEPPKLKPKAYVLTHNDLAPVEHCEAAAVYTERPRPDGGFGMWHGIFVHRFIEYAQSKGREYALAYVRKKSRTATAVCEALDLDQLPQGEHEVEVIVDALTGSARLGAYNDADSTCDVYAKSDIVWSGPALHVDGLAEFRALIGKRMPDHHFADWKAGDKDYSPLGDHFVLISAALYDLHGRPKKGIGAHVVNITTGMPRWKSVVYAPDACEAALQRLKRVQLRLLEAREECHAGGAKPKFTPGDHCKTCRARHACPKSSDEAKAR